MDTRDRLVIRTLDETDLDRMVKLDQVWSGKSRRLYLQRKLHRALAEADVRISLGAELDGFLVGAVLGSVSYGEFGSPEPVAVVDTILVDQDVARQGVASVLLEHLLRNLGAFGIETVRTEVSWNDADLVGFLAHNDFIPVPRIVLERRIPTA
jgi:GNAT superfamily N-acetyltransferase